MNIHHLELFYHVARHGGIMPAVRNIPYGIQQPAVSGQVAQLEAYLGVTLFQRRPFALTDEGNKLYQFIEPFFSNLEKITGDLQSGIARQIRIGASTVILREHLPELLRGVRKKFPGLKIFLRAGFAAQLEEMLLKDEVDLAVTILEKKPETGIHAVEILKLSPALAVEKGSSLRSAAELWKRDKIGDTLICLPPAEPFCKTFQAKLSAMNVDWFTGIEASSLELIEAYVASGLGIGLTLNIPKQKLHPNIRLLPLPEFPPVIIGMMWRGPKTPLIEIILKEAQARAKALV